MGDVYNTTTVEFQNYGVSGAGRQRGLGRGLLKYGLPILGGLSIGIGAVIAFASFLSPESPSWLLFGLAILLIVVGLGLVTLWRFWSWKGRGFTVLKPRPRVLNDGRGLTGHGDAEDVAAREEEFVNQDGPCEEIELPPSPEQSHYKPRHFAGHGYGRKPIMAPLAKAEDITPSLRSSRSSLAYIKDYDSDESSISIDSSLFNMLR